MDKFYCRKLFALTEVNDPADFSMIQDGHGRRTIGRVSSKNLSVSIQLQAEDFRGCIDLLARRRGVARPHANGHGSSVTKPWQTRQLITFVTDAITFHGEDLYLRSISGMPWHGESSLRPVMKASWIAPS
jgi:hypothetical protein